MPTFVQILAFIGTFAFAISDIRLASAKRFDWFGAYVVGLATAIGGGTIRDVLLDVTPGWMTDPIYPVSYTHLLRRCKGTGRLPVDRTNSNASLIALYAELLLGLVAR